MEDLQKGLTADRMRAALLALANKLAAGAFPKVTFVMGGGGAMILAHGFPLATTDIDVLPKGIEFSALGSLVKEVARDLGIAPDWLNPYFSSFSHVLPADYANRLKTVFDHSALRVDALGKDDMLIMKCFAHRRKDIGHARALIRGGANLERVESRIEELLEKKIPEAVSALDFFQEPRSRRARGRVMKLAKPFPSLSPGGLEVRYARFERKERLDAEFFAETSQWVRFDPRLGEIWCAAFEEVHGTIDLREFRTKTAAQAFPQAVGVLLSQIRGPEFRAIERYVLAGVRPVSYQDFFVAVSEFASRSVRRASEAPLRSYRRYGFYGQDVLRNKARGHDGPTEVLKIDRIAKLMELIGRGKRITVDDYIAILPAGVNRRVAQLDLASCKELEPIGSTRGRFYRRKRRV